MYESQVVSIRNVQSVSFYLQNAYEKIFASPLGGMQCNAISKCLCVCMHVFLLIYVWYPPLKLWLYGGIEMYYYYYYYYYYYHLKSYNHVAYRMVPIWTLTHLESHFFCLNFETLQTPIPQEV